jgi:Glycosyl hydrolase 36 superfamily, catalytic domain/Glycosyltransferase family 36
MRCPRGLLRGLVPAVALSSLVGVVLPATGAAAASVPAGAGLSWNAPIPPIASTYGSGHFGQWAVDRFGLPAYEYTADEQTDPAARQAELVGSADAWSQVGNDRVKADAFNHGYTELWSQDRLAQWVDAIDPAHGHLGGGFGYLNVDGTVISTLYDQRPAAASTERAFGVGYFAHSVSAPGVSVHENVYAPFGNDPVLVHDVTITNTSARAENASWFEYWDVNPLVPSTHHYRGISAPAVTDAGRTLTVAQRPYLGDDAPLSVFAAQLSGSTSSHAASQSSFFGDGSVARPRAVVDGRLDDTRAQRVPDGTEGTTLFAFQSPHRIAPGQTVTLRYLYGYGEPGAIPGLVARYRQMADPFAASERRWVQALPKADFGVHLRWLAREFVWDAYLLRSATVDEQACGVHTVTQGGYYQYEIGYNWGTRSWLRYAVPLSYMAPDLARQILVYSAQFQPRSNQQFPYGSTGLCTAYQLGTSDDFDFWFMWAAATYGLGTRDTGFLDTPVHFYRSAASTNLWEHVKLAFDHQQSLLGPHGEYRALSAGDWSDLLPAYSGMTESDLVVAQCAYVYPLLADVADLRGDHAFAQRVRRASSTLLGTLRGQWTGQGWYARGYAGDRQLGSGAIWLEPQPWAMLAGAPSPGQAAALVANIRRYLDGIDAPPAVHGPDLIGTSLSPAANDPGITETTSLPGTGEGDGNAVYPGGTWYEPDGWLAWAYAALGAEVPGSGALALDEYERSTLADHAAAFPDEWVGTTSVDDTCWSFYSSDPGRCGGVLGVTNYEGQNTEQPEWMVMDALLLAGVTATERGYRISPLLPLPAFSVRFPTIGVEESGHTVAGYLRPLATGSLQLQVAIPHGATGVACRVDGSIVRARSSPGWVTFPVPTRRGGSTGWSVRWT